MLHELQRIILPVRPLLEVFEHWTAISYGLMNKTRKRTNQISGYFNMTS
jgi:hypothetical protein